MWYLSDKDDGISKDFQTAIINMFYLLKNLKENNMMKGDMKDILKISNITLEIKKKNALSKMKIFRWLNHRFRGCNRKDYILENNKKKYNVQNIIHFVL